ncbi:hypothetical protein ACWCOY_35005, partial [Streptomyces tubercidicus]
ASGPDREGLEMNLEELRQQAVRIHDLYDEMNRYERGWVWTREEFMLGFTGDVGDLAKLVMAEEGAREVPGGRAALEHELANCQCLRVLVPDPAEEKTDEPTPFQESPASPWKSDRFANRIRAWHATVHAMLEGCRRPGPVRAYFATSSCRSH